ncbi:hypothetical protein LF1_26450 [Rubripirellula obstinata]|uniref:Uncharacterized protein n=1 Tax=Rubripirellula obstinata TaxID=406547 RepID=A0A5B1CHS3_9BACT|nr:hypothetical protein LF1_26450 [Rubripirellula obstinata]
MNRRFPKRVDSRQLQHRLGRASAKESLFGGNGSLMTLSILGKKSPTLSESQPFPRGRAVHQQGVFLSCSFTSMLKTIGFTGLIDKTNS